MNSSKQLKIGAILSYLSIAVNILAGLIYTPWMVNQIGKSHYGLYTLANSLISLFLVDFGLSSATARFVSKYRAEGNQEKVNNFLGVVYKLYLIIDAIIFTILLVVFFLIDTIYVKLTPQELYSFKIVYLIAGSFAVFNFPFVTQNGILTAYEKFIPVKLADIIYRFLLVGLTVVALLLGYGLYALVTVHAIAGLAVIMYKFIVLKKTVPAKVNFKYSDKSLYKEIFGFSVWITVILLAQRLIFNITPTILGITSNSSAIAIFGIVTVIEGYAYTVTTAINGMFMPKISKDYVTVGDGDMQAFGKRVQPLFLKVGKYQFAVNGLIVVGFAILGQYFINLWMGEGYSQAYLGILLVTIPGLFFNSLQIASTSLVVVNKVKLQAIVSVITGVVNVILSLILSYFYGVIGACISICIAYLIRAILTNIIAGIVLKLDIKQFIKSCYLKMLVPFMVTFITGVLLNLLITANSWLIFLGKVVIVTIIYVFATCILGLNREERDFIVSKIKNKVGRK